jgi:hypothetical protein
MHMYRVYYTVQTIMHDGKAERLGSYRYCRVVTVADEQEIVDACTEQGYEDVNIVHMATAHQRKGN